MKVKFVATAMLSVEGEAQLGDANSNIFTKPVKIWPVITLISPEAMTDEQKAQLQLMALHQLVLQALTLVTPKGMQVESTSPVDMSPTEGEKN